MAKLNINRALWKAKTHERKGEMDEALNLYNSVLAVFPGNIRAKQGLAKLSQPNLHTSAENNPSDEIIHKLVALYNKGQIGTVVQECDRLTKESPRSFLLWNILGAANKAQGKFEEAIAAFSKALLIKPDYAEAQNNMGAVFQVQGKFEKAIAAFNKALLIKPDYAEAHYNMGIAFQALRKLDDAISAYNKALLIKPDYAEALNNLGTAFQEQGKFEEAVAAYNKALLIKPDYAQALNNIGTAFQVQGKFEEAVAAHNKALLIKPDYAEAHRNLSTLKKYAHPDPQIAQMRKLYADTNISEEDRCHLCFALAKSSEDLGHFEDAFFYLKEGNAIRKESLDYDIARDKKRFSTLKETANSFNKFLFKPAREKNTPIPVFILGMPRSGTTLIEQIISNHSKVTGLGELEFLGEFGSPISEGKIEVSGDKLRTVRNQYLDELMKLSAGKPFVTDKMPNNFLYIGLICSAFPEAKIVHVERSPAATCWSNFKHYFLTTELNYCFDLLDVVHYYQMYEELMLFWSEHYPERIYNLNYEQLTADQETETKKLIQYLGIDWEDACLSPEKNKRYVKTASSMQVREKVYKGSSVEWKKFEKYLDKAFDELPN